MGADFSGTCPKPGFWVWAKEGEHVFWFQDEQSPEYWRRTWARVHGPDVYVPVTDAGYTPKLF